MFFRQVFDPELAQYAYLIGCQRTGEALVIDPERDIDRYDRIAAEEGLHITSVAETHIHADFLSGARQFGQREGVKLYLSDDGPEDWKSNWARNDSRLDVKFLHDGDAFGVGNIELRALFTPGHTPEHMSFLVTDKGGGAETPMGLVSGDFVFVGDLGRPDLLESAAGTAGAMEPAAKQLFESVARFLELDDEIQVWPAHGAGSACGKALGAVPTSTVGYEKTYNASISPYHDGRDAFVSAILDGQPEPPAYFARMKRLNRDGVPLLDELPRPQRVTADQVPEILDQDPGILDLRSDRIAFMARHLPGAIFAPGKTLSTIAGSYLDPERPLLVMADPSDVESVVRRLVRIGLDDVRWLLAADELGDVPGDLESIEQMDFQKAQEHFGDDGAHVIDVRRATEFEDGHVQGALNVAHTRLQPRLDEVPDEGTLYVHCQSGARAASAASFLAATGRDVVHIDDSFENAPGA